MKGLAEYAKSARASCRQCSAKIEKGTLRLGWAEKGGAGSFPVTRWFHPECYFKAQSARTRVPAPSELHGYSSLKQRDQDTLATLAAKLALSSSGSSRGGEVGDAAAGRAGEDGSAGSAVDARLQVMLRGFSAAQAPSQYKGVPLPEPWRSFETVIFHPGDGVEPNSRIAAFDFDGCLADTDVRIMGAHAWKLQYPTVPAKLRDYHAKGFKLAIFTNESNIDRFTKARKKAVDSKIGRLNALMELLEVPVQVFVACGTSTSDDAFRKPAPGMWRLLERMNEGVAVDLEQSFYVGDAAGRETDHSDADIGFAQSVGLRFMVPEDVFF